MNKKTKLALAVIGIGAIAYYLYTKNKSASTGTTKNYAGTVGDRLGFASTNNVHATDGNNFNNNRRYGMTGQSTFFTNEPEKLK